MFGGGDEELKLSQGEGHDGRIRLAVWMSSGRDSSEDWRMVICDQRLVGGEF